MRYVRNNSFWFWGILFLTAILGFSLGMIKPAHATMYGSQSDTSGGIYGNAQAVFNLGKPTATQTNGTSTFGIWVKYNIAGYGQGRCQMAGTIKKYSDANYTQFATSTVLYDYEYFVDKPVSTSTAPVFFELPYWYTQAGNSPQNFWDKDYYYQLTNSEAYLAYNCIWGADVTNSKIAYSMGDYTGYEYLPAISFNTPIPSAFTYDFDEWKINLERPPSCDPTFVTVVYQRSQPYSAMAYTDSAQFYPCVMTSPLKITKSQPLWDISVPTGSAWDISAHWFAADGLTLLASTGLLETLVAPPGTGITGTSTIVTTCDATSGFWANSLCHVGTALFSPSVSVLNKYMNLGDAVKNKPPFGYISSVITAFGTVSEGSDSVGLPDLSAFNPIFSPLKTGLATLIWLSFVFGLFSRFRHFEF